jgi:hypothetical protein
MTTRRHTRRALTAAIALTLASTIAACGPKRSEVLEAQAAADAEAAADTQQPAIPTATDPASPDLAPQAPSGPGVTDTEVKVGFVIVDQTALSALLGVDSPDSGDIDGQIRTLVDHVNANGGVAGRNVVPVIKVFDALRDTPATEEQLCREFTEDDQVFAVVLLGQFQENARPCYAAKQTLMIDQSLFPVETEDYESLAPYLWQPGLPEYGKLFRGLAVALVETEFLTTDTTLGIVGIDTEQNRRVFDRDLLPVLNELGKQAEVVTWVDPTSSATLQAGQQEAVLSFKEAGVDRVVVVGGSRLLAFLLTIAIPENYFPRYAVTTFDNPDYNVRETPEAMIGSVGISVLPGFDIADGQLPFPNPESDEQRCLDVLATGGHTFESRANARQATLYCDGLFLLQEATAGVTGSLTAEVVGAGVVALGDDWVGAANYAAGFSAGSYDGATGYRVMRFDETCLCFVLDGPTREFE